jgi:predicted anti-sigma-YlaC factor YlaD
MNLKRCEHVRPSFSERLDGEEPTTANRFEVGFHLAVCPPCRRFFRSLEAVKSALRDLRDADIEKEDGSP